MKTKLLPMLALSLAMLAPVACSEPAPEAPAAAPEGPAGLAVTDGRLMLPAVAGNPAAVYFNIANTGTKNMMIRAVSVQGAGNAVMHQMGTWNRQPSMDEVMQQAVAPGQTVSFEPGALHVMVYDLADTVTAGGSAEVTLTFVGGDKLSFPAEVRAAGDER
jgi:copper(I)-binding protein